MIRHCRLEFPLDVSEDNQTHIIGEKPVEHRNKEGQATLCLRLHPENRTARCQSTTQDY